MKPRIQINVAFDPDTAFKVKAEAERKGVSVASLIRQIVGAALEVK